MRRSQPLIRLDPGWLFVLAGLALLVAAAVIPSGRELHALRVQVDELRHAERANFAALEAYARFLQEFDDRDPALMRRLATSQLNLIPSSATPLLVAGTVNATVADWIESTVEPEPFEPSVAPETLLTRWTADRGRLWAFGVSVFMVFIGLMSTPSPKPGREVESSAGEVPAAPPVDA